MAVSRCATSRAGSAAWTLEGGEEGESGTLADVEPEVCGFCASTQHREAHEVRVKRRYLADHEAPARPKDAMQLAQRSVLIGNLSKHRDKVGAVKAGVGVWKAAGVPLARSDVRHPPVARTPHEVVQHLLLDIDHIQGPSRLKPPRDRE